MGVAAESIRPACLDARSLTTSKTTRDERLERTHSITQAYSRVENCVVIALYNYVFADYSKLGAEGLSFLVADNKASDNPRVL